MPLLARSDDFARELRRWRGIRRLSQLDLAIRSGTTQRHLSFIEQGRSRPGRTMVLRLAESLELSLRERNSLLFAAGFAPVYAESSIDDAELAPMRQAMGQILRGHLPYPAMVVRSGGVLVAANAAVDVLIAGAEAALLVPPINILRLAVHPSAMAPRVANLGEWGRHILHNVRGEALRHPDGRLDDLASELERHLPAGPPGPDHVGFAVPLRLRCAEGELRLVTTLTSFATAIDVTLSELHLEAFLPADEPTATILAARELDRQRGVAPPSLLPPQLVASR